VSTWGGASFSGVQWVETDSCFGNQRGKRIVFNSSAANNLVLAGTIPRVRLPLCQPCRIPDQRGRGY